VHRADARAADEAASTRAGWGVDGPMPRAENLATK
jgi:hypothetical protein